MMRGQEEIIRLVTDVPMAGHRNTFHYTYEVVDDGSVDFGLVDYAYSDRMLNAGHIYRVRFNDETRNPRIVEAQEIQRESAAGRYIAITCGQKDPLSPVPKTSGQTMPHGHAHFSIADRLCKGDQIGSLRSMVATSDGTLVYKLRWSGQDQDNYVLEEALQACT